MGVDGTRPYNVAPQYLNAPANDGRRGISAGGVRALIANGPAMYREVISAALRELRPAVEFGAPVWVELYPEGAPYAVMRSFDGSRTTFPGMDFDTLLSILDSV